MVKEETTVVKNDTEMSAYALKISSKSDKGTCESLSVKKLKFESHVTEKNKSLK